MKSNAISILDAPSNLGLKPPAEGKEPGVKHMAQAIRSRGLLQRLGAVDAGMVEAPAYHGSLDVRLGIRNAEGLAIFAKVLAVRIRELLGLTPEELATLLKTVYRSKHCAGMQITIYDPTLDPDGVCGNRIVETLVLAFA
jgi:hypothetical protein